MAKRRTDYQDDEIVVSSEHVKLVAERCLRHRRIASLMVRKDMTSRKHWTTC